MDYSISETELVAAVKEEISRVAGVVRDDSGRSMFDEVIYHMRDTERIVAYIREAESQLIARLGIVNAAQGHVQGNVSVSFDNPDMPTSLQVPARTSITNFIVYHTTASWLIGKAVQGQGAEYTARAKTEEDKVVSMLLKRSTNSRTS